MSSKKYIQAFILKFVRKSCFQSLWGQLFHYSKVGMNYWGGATVGYSGEEYALRYADLKLRQKRRKITIFDVGANIGSICKVGCS